MNLQVYDGLLKFWELGQEPIGGGPSPMMDSDRSFIISQSTLRTLYPLSTFCVGCGTSQVERGTHGMEGADVSLTIGSLCF